MSGNFNPFSSQGRADETIFGIEKSAGVSDLGISIVLESNWMPKVPESVSLCCHLNVCRMSGENAVGHVSAISPRVPTPTSPVSLRTQT